MKESKAFNNPQSGFEDSIFGPNGTHPAPKALPYPTQPISTLYGDTIEYLIPDGQKEKVLNKLYPFGRPPALAQTMMDIHEKKTFVVKDFKVVQQGDYVLLVSPYFANSGGSVVDWQQPGSGDDGVHVSAVPDELAISAFSAGEADAITGMPFGTAKPPRGEGMSAERYGMIEEAYEAGFAQGEQSRIFPPTSDIFTSTTHRRTARRPR